MTMIDEVSFEVVQPFAGRAARDHVSISDTRATRWFAAVEVDQIVGIAGLIKFGTGMRIKGVWVEPAARGKGIGHAFVTRLIEVAEFECAPTIEAIAYRPDYYEARGFQRCGTLPNGAVRVRKRL